MGSVACRSLRVCCGRCCGESTQSRSEVKALGAAHRTKKRHVQEKTRLPTKSFGNCLLGFHCSQKAQAENRTSASFPPVAGPQQRKLINRLSTGSEGDWGKPASCVQVTKVTLKCTRLRRILTNYHLNPEHSEVEANGHQPQRGARSRIARSPTSCLCALT